MSLSYEDQMKHYICVRHSACHSGTAEWALMLAMMLEEKDTHMMEKQALVLEAKGGREESVCLSDMTEVQALVFFKSFR